MENDTISRQAAIDEIRKWKRYETTEGLVDRINKLPSAPQRTGRWELIDDTEFRIPGYRCSVCHCECEDWDKKPTYSFCPHCGARMEDNNESD